MRGELKEALQMHESAISISRASGAAYSLASNLGSYGTTLIMAGDLQAGCERLQESIILSEKQGFKQFICTGSRSRAWGLLLLGQFADAHACAARARELADDFGDRYNSAVAHYILLASQTEERNKIGSQVISAWESAIAELNALNGQVDEGNARLALADALIRFSDQTDLAKAHIDAARGLFRSAQFAQGQGWCFLLDARLAAKLGDDEEVESSYKAALSIARRLGAGHLLRLAEEGNKTMPI